MRPVAAIAVVLVGLIAASGGRAATRLDSETPVLLKADELTYDAEAGVVSAAGHVEVSQGERVLLADRITYNERTDTVIASGNVAIMEPNGEVLFADYVELTDNFKNGIVKGIRVLFADQSRLAANGAARRDGNRTVMSKAVFSPCKLCEKDPSRPPLWQIKAVQVIHNQKAKRIEYHDAWLEFYGVPVFYTPFFSHPDPTVKRQTGFLAPNYGSSSDLGLTLQTPFYFNIAPDKDATFAPIFTTEEGVVLTGQYRQRLGGGEFALDGSITRPQRRNDNGRRLPGHKTRGHIFGHGRFDLDPTWRWGFDAERSTDDTYVRRYDFSNQDTLTSDLFLEGFRGRNYFRAEGFAFQDLREDDDPGETPAIWPNIDYSFVGEPGRYGQRYGLNFNLLQLTRTESTDTRRLSLGGEWRLPYVAPAGDVYTLSLSVRGDLYLVNNVLRSAPPNAPSFTGVTGRVNPQLAFEWRYPFVRDAGTVRQLVEPVASFVVSPFENNTSKIPNEDSITFEFDDTNLFSADRFPGLDRVEGGPRANVGIKAGVYGVSGGSTEILFGQTYRAERDPNLAKSTGLAQVRSDYVGRAVITPSDKLQIIHRFRLDHDDFKFLRNEIDLSVMLSTLQLTAGYVDISRDLTSDHMPRKEVRASARWQLTENWAAMAAWRRDLSQGGGNISAAAGIVYEDECFLFRLEAKRRFTRDRDIRPSDSINLTVVLKQLGR